MKVGKGTKLPNPGSKEAIKRGCTCPIIDNHKGAGITPTTFWVSVDCPLHSTVRERIFTTNK